MCIDFPMSLEDCRRLNGITLLTLGGGKSKMRFFRESYPKTMGIASTSHFEVLGLKGRNLNPRIKLHVFLVKVNS